MTDPKHIDRRSLLTSSAGAFAAVFLGGCGDDAGGNGPLGSATTSADAALGTDASAASASTGTASSATPSGSPSSSAGQTGDAGDSAVDASPSDGGGEDGGRGDGGSRDAGASDGATTDGGTQDGGSDGGTSEAGSGGTPDSGGTSMCESIVETVNNHAHIVDIPASDVEAAFDKTYVLEDGGAGHSHTLALSAYDFIYLQGGSTIEVRSSTDSAHSHLCTVTCAG